MERTEWGRSLRRVVLAVAFAALVCPSQGEGQWVVGAQAGVSAFGVAGRAPDDAGYGRQGRVMVSALLGYEIGSSVVVRVEPSLIQKGSGVSFQVEGLEEPVDSLSLNLDYISVPVVAQVFTRGGRGFVTGGIEIGFLSSASLATVNSGEELDVKDLLESTDLSWVFGAGGLVRRSQPEMSLELRYSQSLSKAFEGTSGGLGSGLPTGLRSSGFQLMAGVSWRLGGDR